MARLVLDPKLSPASWEVRPEKGKAKRTRKEIDEDALLAHLDDPSVDVIAFGEEVHRRVLRLMAKPGLKTPSQRAVESHLGLARQPSTNKGFETSSTGTLDPEGDAS